MIKQALTSTISLHKIANKIVNAPSHTRFEQPVKMTRKQVLMKKCLRMMLNVAKSGEGALIVFGPCNEFETLFPNFFRQQDYNILDEGLDKVVEKLACVDGAVVIDHTGLVKAYGARILAQKNFQGKGTRHSAACGISHKRGVLAFIASEEDGLVRVFKEGSPIIQLNPFNPTSKHGLNQVVNFIERSDLLP